MMLWTKKFYFSRIEYPRISIINYIMIWNYQTSSILDKSSNSIFSRNKGFEWENIILFSFFPRAIALYTQLRDTQYHVCVRSSTSTGVQSHGIINTSVLCSKRHAPQFQYKEPWCTWCNTVTVVRRFRFLWILRRMGKTRNRFQRVCRFKNRNREKRIYGRSRKHTGVVSMKRERDFSPIFRSRTIFIVLELPLSGRTFHARSKLLW